MANDIQNGQEVKVNRDGGFRGFSKDRKKWNGFDFDTLDRAFRAIVKQAGNPDDWKAPIKGFVYREIVLDQGWENILVLTEKMIRSAIAFHTATDATRVYHDDLTDRFFVSAIGYRNGPAGDF